MRYRRTARLRRKKDNLAPGPLLHATCLACYRGPDEVGSSSIGSDCAPEFTRPKGAGDTAPAAHLGHAPSRRPKEGRCFRAPFSPSDLSIVILRGAEMLHLTSNAGTNRHPLRPVTVRFAAGEIQFVKQSGCVLIGLTSRLFDLEGYPQSDHACARPPLGAALTSWSWHASRCWPGRPSRGKAQAHDLR